MAETDQTEIQTETEPTLLQSSFPPARVKRIMKLDTEINKINSDALFAISNATEMFLKLLAEKSMQVTVEKKRKTIKAEDMRIAVKRHRPTADFLLDSIPVDTVEPKANRSRKSNEKDKDLGSGSGSGTRGIDSFFKKCLKD
ncbi:nuclear transcription factor Y subunit C-3-like [Bidens hawaiensis]|uniref:nuclear transcription factor Y subunit C-3-like n=1 Tax=Bidens hawaiensis TaxID=980011 RepID=UPI00404A780E